MSSNEGLSESVFSQEAFHGQWITLAGGTHNFTASQDYTVELTPADTENGFCKYQMADQMRWVYDGPSMLPPVNTVPPTISGQAEQGQTLTEAHGSWTNSPTYYSYQWEDCDSTGISCSPIAGATSQSYTLAASDVGHAIVVQEVAVNAAGASKPASSDVTLLILAPIDPFDTYCVSSELFDARRLPQRCRVPLHQQGAWLHELPWVAPQPTTTRSLGSPRSRRRKPWRGPWP
ncbi:MAG: hypothetical protein ACRDJ3_03565, partial [Solirubrobacteraceae bacterium]